MLNSRRVQYEPSYLDSFLPSIASGELSELNRLSLLDDLTASVQSGRTSADVVLKMISEGFRHDESYVVWSAIANFFSKLNTLLADEEEAYELLKRFQECLRQVCRPHFCVFHEIS